MAPTASCTQNEPEAQAVWLGGLHTRLQLVLQGVSHNAVARTTGYNSETVRRYRTKTEPSARFVKRICEEYGVTPTWLLTGEGEQTTQAQCEAIANGLDFAAVLTLLGQRLNELQAKLDGCTTAQTDPEPQMMHRLNGAARPAQGVTR
ncbi:MAG: helix-turn-helix transcriptional regulator [Phycisphaerales bacterium]|nr:helix-turn-helix transcriptional regulator [Phycisphaerales bacterium]